MPKLPFKMREKVGLKNESGAMKECQLILSRYSFSSPNSDLLSGVRHLIRLDVLIKLFARQQT